MDLSARSLLLCVVLGVCHAADPLTSLSSNAARLARKLDALNDSLVHVQSVLSTKQNWLDRDSSRLTHDGATLTTLTHQLTNASAQLTALDSFLNTSFTSNLEPRVSTLEQPIAFQVSFHDDNVTTKMADRGPVLFDNVQYKTGLGDFSNSTGWYTAPSDGTYAFFLTVQRLDSRADVCLEVTLQQSGQQWSGCVVSACPPGHSAASNMCLVHLRQGDAIHAHSLITHQILGNVHTTLSGFKIL
ncbi:uncharacterized protein LOC143299010 [Babylonia areolata]|uniref:uncharacterized protein LOC143299010 n=1 Tax=Babylonia areolata TaxID=304850 RepID=UPI003FCF3B53